MIAEQPRQFLTFLFGAAISAADPKLTIPNVLPDKPRGRTIVVGAGKGVAQMAAALEDAWDFVGNGSLQGSVVTRYGFGTTTKHIKVLEASHPVPDAAGETGATHLMELVCGLNSEDLVIALVAGGGSALLPMPPSSVSLEDKIEMNRILLASGAPISAMNTIRKHVSQIKGGKLAKAAHPAKVVGLIVSDIPGDNLAYVASGPTVADNATVEDALELIRHYQMEMPVSVINHLNSGFAGSVSPDDASLKNVTNHLIASACVSLEAVQSEARKQGIETVILSDAMEGEASEVAKVHAAMVHEVLFRDRPFKKPVLLLSGGECTVTINNKDGVGGPSTEFALSLGIELAGIDGWSALVADTDGIDGAGDNAGAFVDGGTVLKMRNAHCDAKTALVQNESYKAFQSIGDLYSPGPTGTNVNDFRGILITG